MHRLVLLIFLAFYNLNFAQFHLVDSMHVPNLNAWTVDGMQQLVTTDGVTLKKFSKQWNLLYENSQRSIGSIDNIIPINAMRLVVFSKSFQTLCYLDNTLTIQNNCLNLQDYQIELGTEISGSAVNERIWVYDEINSGLRAVELSGRKTSQNLFNLKGLISLESIIKLTEHNNQLFILCEDVLYQFDTFGTLIQQFVVEGWRDLSLNGNQIIGLKAEELEIIQRLDGFRSNLTLPLSNSESFRLVDNTLYLQHNSTIYRYNFINN